MTHQELDSKIAALSRTIKGSLFDSGHRDKGFWQDVWRDIKEIGQGFRVVRYPTKHDRDAAWATFQEAVSEAKEQQAEKVRNRARRDESSTELLREVLAKANAAWPHEDGFTTFLEMITGARIFAELIVGAMEFVVHVLTLGLLRIDEKDPRKAKLLASGEAMKEAWVYFKAHSRDLLPHHREAAWKVLNGVQGELDKEWTAWKTEQADRRRERTEFFDRNRRAKEKLIREAQDLIGSHREPMALQQAKNLAQEWRTIKSAGRDADEELWQEFRNTLDEFFAERKKEFEQRQQDHRDRQAKYRQHVLEQIETVEDKLVKARARREANEERLSNARSDDYAERVREWIEQDDANIDRLEGWLRDWHEKLERIDD